jgi:hypothetical protein
MRVAALSLPLAACLGPQQPDLAQLERMRTEDTTARANESIGCLSRDRVCAQLMQLHGEACAMETFEGPPADRPRMRACALAAARRLPGLLPADAPADEQQAVALAILDGWRGALAAGDPAADPASLDAAEAQLRAIPGGGAYADTLAAARPLHAAIAGTLEPAVACPQLQQALATLPASPPPMLAPRVADARSTAAAVRSKLGCT